MPTPVCERNLFKSIRISSYESESFALDRIVGKKLTSLRIKKHITKWKL